MLIMSQDRKRVVNLDNVTCLCLALAGDGYTNEIYAEVIDEAPISLGVYVTKQSAKDVLEKIASIQGGATTFYMPEEWEDEKSCDITKTAQRD